MTAMAGLRKASDLFKLSCTYSTTLQRAVYKRIIWLRSCRAREYMSNENIFMVPLVAFSFGLRSRRAIGRGGGLVWAFPGPGCFGRVGLFIPSGVWDSSPDPISPVVAPGFVMCPACVALP